MQAPLLPLVRIIQLRPLAPLLTLTRPTLVAALLVWRQVRPLRILTPLAVAPLRLPPLLGPLPQAQTPAMVLPLLSPVLVTALAF